MGKISCLVNLMMIALVHLCEAFVFMNEIHVFALNLFMDSLAQIIPQVVCVVECSHKVSRNLQIALVSPPMGQVTRSVRLGLHVSEVRADQLPPHFLIVKHGGHLVIEVSRDISVQLH
jgi:hypothetical protein